MTSYLTAQHPENLTELAIANTAMDAVRTAWTVDDAETLTDEQRTALLSFPGWGALARAFDATPTGSWLRIADELEELLPAGALTSARLQVDTSFFTPRPIVDAVFAILRSVGFTGGRVLEPGCGAGNFMSMAPSDWAIDWTGVEIDHTSARIARLLNPGAKILVAPLEKTAMADESFDAVVGNVPFSGVSISDGQLYASSLHEYFLMRAARAVRPGGYVIAVTSRHSMDNNQGLSRVLAGDDGQMPVKLVGAVRLPSGAFASAGTQVVTDVLILRKDAPGSSAPGWDDRGENALVASPTWPYTAQSKRPTITEPAKEGKPGVPTEVNAYWKAHPEHVAGRMAVTSFDRNPLVVLSDNPADDLARALGNVTASLPPQTPNPAPDTLDDVQVEDEEGRKTWSFYTTADGMFQVTPGGPRAVRNNAELRALIQLRDLAVKLLELESDPSLPEVTIAPTRAEASAAYAAYAAKFGSLNRGTLVEGKEDPETGLPALSWRRPPMAGFRSDPDYPLVMALEVFDQDTGEAAPAPILNHRVNVRPAPIERVDTAAEAIAVSMGETNSIDLDRIAGLLGLPDADAARAALGELVYSTGAGLVAAGEFLSGNIRAKLAEARALDDGTEESKRNIAALEAALPADLGPLDIAVSLGVPWVTAGDVREFIREVIGGNASVSYTESAATWAIERASDVWSTPEARIAYGTSYFSPTALVELALNNRNPVATDSVWDHGTTRQVRNIPASVAATEKQRALDDRFSTWIWEDKGRADRIVREYNDRFNSHVVRRYDGSMIQFPGLAADVVPWKHQRDAVARIVAEERTLIGHPVGAGKTKTMILAAKTLRRFGLANKPMIVVPNHLLDQIVREAQQAYPTGKFLIASREDLTQERRRVFAARCATGDWDAVVITHQAFTSIQVDPEVESRWVQEQKADLVTELQGQGGGYSQSKTAKAIARAVRALDQRIDKLRSGIGDGSQIRFDQLGVDYLMIDEAHLFRRLDTGSTSRGNGFGSGTSKRATDLLLKIDLLAESYPGKPVASMFTGTPWSNTLAETWVWQRYLQPQTLAAAGVKAFDPWVATFVRYETNIEVAPDGVGFRMQRRPVAVKNLAELKTMLGQVADILDPDALGLERPTHTIEVRVSLPGTEQREFVHDLARRADALRQSREVERPDGRGLDSMLLVCNDGRKVALDPRLVGIAEPSTKVEDAAVNIARIYRENRDRIFGESPRPGALQLVFLDLGTPRPDDTQVYGRLRRALVDHGVPATQVRFIHEAKTDRARAALFAQCRDGEVSVLIGSTSKVGMGTNIQTRLAALHHVDAPWLPAEVTQREGRALRPFNLSGHVGIYRYITEGTFDAYTWQALERKSKSFDVLYDSANVVREVEDISDVSLGYGEVKALAAGNPKLLEQAKLQAKVQKLRLMRSVHQQSVNAASKQADDAAARAGRLRDRAAILGEIVECRTEATPEHAEAISSFAAELIGPKEQRSYYYQPRVAYRGVSLRNQASSSARASAADSGIRLELLLDYRHAGELTLPPKVLRRGAAAVAQSIVEQADYLIDTAETAAQERLARAAELEVVAERARAAATSSVFDGEAELEEAVRALAEVDALIAAEAEEPVTLAA